MNTSCKAEFYIASTCCPTTTLISDVVFHASVHVNLKLYRLHRSSETWIELSGIFVVGIIFGVVNVLFWPVDA